MARQARLQQERGAVIIHVAIALIALLAFTAFIIDYGLMWVSRRQAQNVVDSAALAGALASIHDGGTEAVVNLAAQHFAASNPIWGQGNSAANVDVSLSGPGNSIPPCGEDEGCVRVDVFRNTPDREDVIRGNSLPTYFAHLVGIDTQGVRATATAEIASGNAIKCLLPFGIIDRWADNYDELVDTTYYPNDGLMGTAGWTQNDKYQPIEGDVYVPPYNQNPNHTGWTVGGDYGRQLIIKEGSMNNYSTGWARRIDLPDSTGANDYSWDIRNCNETPIGIATLEEPCAPAAGGDTTGREINGCVSASTGMAQGPTVQNGITPLIQQDPNAAWSSTATGPSGQTGAVVDGDGELNMGSPRVRPIVVIDIDHYIASDAQARPASARWRTSSGSSWKASAATSQLDPGEPTASPRHNVPTGRGRRAHRHDAGVVS
jgi:hypothetical protein